MDIWKRSRADPTLLRVGPWQMTGSPCSQGPAAVVAPQPPAGPSVTARPGTQSPMCISHFWKPVLWSSLHGQKSPEVFTWGGEVGGEGAGEGLPARGMS